MSSETEFCSKNLCIAGFTGFPIQIQGWSGFIEKDSIKTPNDIKLQFGPNSNTPITYIQNTGYLSFNGNNTFFMGGTQYTVVIVRLCKPSQDGLSDFNSSTIQAEFQIWGIPSVNSNFSTDVAVLLIPIKGAPVGTRAGNTIIKSLSGNSVSLFDTIPQGKNVNVVRYMTCVETDSSTKPSIKIGVAYWTGGALYTSTEISSVVNARLTSKLSPYGIPDILGYKLLSTRTPTINTELSTGKIIRKNIDCRYIVKSSILQTYTTNLSATTPEFKNGFRLIMGFEQKTTIKGDMSGYKCIAIKRSRDIVNGKLVLDPATGKPFSEEIDDAEQRDAEDSITFDETQEANAAAMWKQICVVLGIILGVTVLAGILLFIYYIFGTRKTAGLPPQENTIKSLSKLVPKNVPQT